MQCTEVRPMPSQRAISLGSIPCAFRFLTSDALARVVGLRQLVLYRTFVPNFSLNTDYVVTVGAVLGTTITPYCFFWHLPGGQR